MIHSWSVTVIVSITTSTVVTVTSSTKIIVTMSHHQSGTLFACLGTRISSFPSHKLSISPPHRGTTLRLALELWGMALRVPPHPQGGSRLLYFSLMSWIFCSGRCLCWYCWFCR